MKSVNVLPRSARSDVTDRPEAKSIRRRQNAQLLTRTSTSSYLADLALRDFRHPVTGTAKHLARIEALRVLIAAESPLTPLAISISRVVGSRPDEKVIRSDARWVVAAVADGEARRDRTVGEFPRDAVREFSTTRVARAGSEHPVLHLPRAQGALPFPAAVALADLAPEPILAARHGLRCPSALDRTEPTSSLPPGLPRDSVTTSFAGVRHGSHARYCTSVVG